MLVRRRCLDPKVVAAMTRAWSLLFSFIIVFFVVNNWIFLLQTILQQTSPVYTTPTAPIRRRHDFLSGSFCWFTSMCLGSHFFTFSYNDKCLAVMRLTLLTFRITFRENFDDARVARRESQESIDTISVESSKGEREGWRNQVKYLWSEH